MSMMFIGIGTAVVSIGLEGYSMEEQNRAAKNAASVDNATASYNAKFDDAMAAQLDEDTQANITGMRENDAAYLSKQAASYAGAGVLATTGSALDAQITNAGRFEQQIQQAWVNSIQKQAAYYSQAKAGLAYGAAQAESDRMSGTIALINGAAKISSQAFSAEESGTFS